MLFPLLISCLLTCAGAEQPHQERPEAGPEVPPASTAPPREESPARERSPARGDSPARDGTADPAATEAATEDLGAGNPLAQKLSLGFCFFRFSFFGFLIDFPPFFVLQTHLRLSQWRQRAPTREVLVLMRPPARRPPGLLLRKPARGRAIALTTLRPQERQALRRPPIPLPLLRSRAPRSPSPAPT